MRCFLFGDIAMRVQNIHRVGIYLRLSRDDGNSNAESMSIVTQKQMLTDYVKERGWDLTETYIDEAVIIGLKTLRLKKCQKHAAF